MKITKLFAASALALAMSATAVAAPFRITAPLGEDYDGAMAYLYDYDTSAKIDSVLISESTAVFTGDIDKAFAGRLIVDGSRLGTFIVEPGDILVDQVHRQAFGTPLNEKVNSIDAKLEEIISKYQATTDEAERNSIVKGYYNAVREIVVENVTNPIGLLYFGEMSQEMDYADIVAFLDENPGLKNYKRVQSNLAQLEKKAKTMPGAKFIDFEVTYDGKTSRLSDYVGKGQYVLVDFWASWCGPCIRQTAVIKELYNEYKDKGLVVLGVAVWDEPANTVQAIAKHELPWECILNAQTIPTDIYGIVGIPSIFLFGPDGTILSRDKQDDALRADVRAAMEGKL
jgi:thiol-disulfide isomerase/thioredoxin